MTGAMASLATGTDQVRGDLAVASLFFVGVILFFLTLGLNIVGNRFVRRVRQVYWGSDHGTHHHLQPRRRRRRAAWLQASRASRRRPGPDLRVALAASLIVSLA